METPVHRRVSAASTGFGKPAGAMNSAFDTGTSARTKRSGGKQPPLPPLDFSALSVADGGPPHTATRARGVTKYDGLFDLLDKDDTGRTGIPKLYKSALQSALKKYLSRRPALGKSRFIVRDAADGSVGVWRVAAGAK